MNKNIFMTIVFFLVFPQFLCAVPPEQRWNASYNGPENCDDFTSGIAIDSGGNVYVTGRSDNSDAIPDYATIKYDPNGNQLWTARYDGQANDFDQAKAIAVDDSGNVYVTGQSWSNETWFDYATIKYDPNGTQKWNVLFNGQGNLDDYAEAITLDNAGNIYITGSSTSNSRFQDYLTIKYDPNGSRKWAVIYNYGNGPQNSDDSARAIAVDAQGYTYITGCSDGNTNKDFATIKYDPNGNQQWAARYNGSLTSEDYAQDIALDNQGNIYVTGESTGGGTGHDFTTVKYDTNGIQKWAAYYNGTANIDDYAQAIVSDSAGNIYVTGSSFNIDTYFDYATIKYDPNGNQKWAVRYNGPEGLEDYAQDIALDNQGNIYVTGISGTSTGNDYATVKYDPNGNQEWVIRYNGPEFSDDGYDSAIAADNLGNVFVSGHNYNEGFGNDYLTLKYTQHNYCTSNSGDLNGNCIVNFEDYTILAANWHIAREWNDLAILADNWLKCGFALMEDCW